MDLEFIFVVGVIALGFYFFDSSDEKNSELKQTEVKNIPTDFKPVQTEAKKFVKVIFKKGDRKRYDYFLGDNFDIKVGDFVEVWAYSKFSGSEKLKVVKVVYISEPGEISYKATKTVVGKAERQKW